MRIELAGLEVGYGDLSITKAIDMEISPGELHFIIGRNGTGKSTLLRTMAGLLHPIAGEVRISGDSLYTLSPKERARYIYYLPGRTELRSRITISEFLHVGVGALTPLVKRGTDWNERALAATKKVGISELLESSVQHISDGEFQKMMLALVLLKDPQVLLLDEPLSHLDPPSQAEILELLAGLAADRIVVISSHQLSAIRHSLARVNLLNRLGELREVQGIESMGDKEIINLYD